MIQAVNDAIGHRNRYPPAKARLQSMLEAFLLKFPRSAWVADVIADQIPDPPRVITLAISHNQSFCGDSPPYNCTAHLV